MYSLPSLPYSYGALEPYIEAQIMELHHAKHQQAYVDGLNRALEKHPKLFKITLEDLLKDLTVVPADIQTAVRNHGGGVWNHTFFWSVMSAQGGGEPIGSIAEAIINSFEEFSVFQQQFTNLAKSRFGSGWVWLSFDKDGLLNLSSTANQDTPLSEGMTPLLGLDVWEHAYYLQYFNRRVDYIAAWWNVIDWQQVEQNYQNCLK